MAEQQEYLRLSVAQRAEHWIVTLSFGLLALTGLPQKFAGDGWAEMLIRVLGGIEAVRMIHHVAALVLALEAVYHIVVVAYKVFVLRVQWTMCPRLEDALNALDMLRYNVGWAKEPPKLDRYSYEEKAEYWAMVWGTLIMGATGFLLWNPILAARFLPGELIPAAKAAHGAEAILAVLAIFVWHFYNVHLKTFNPAVFTGKLTEEQMAREHGLELERIRQGIVEPRPAPQVIKQRERTFIPVAALATIVMLGAVWLFVSYEQTSIPTLPRRAQVYVPFTPTPAPRADVTPAAAPSAKAKGLPASHAGRTICNVCHETGIAGPKNPADHAGRADTTCVTCHQGP